jgi:hypothetical protein
MESVVGWVERSQSEAKPIIAGRQQTLGFAPLYPSYPAYRLEKAGFLPAVLLK